MLFRSEDHPFREDTKSFYKGYVETKSPIPYLSGYDMWELVRHLPTAMESPCHNPPGYGISHKFTKQSIFWSLPYWRDNLLPHNIDVMHNEKNVFENSFNTVMGVKGKTKDNLSSRKDIGWVCDRPELAVDADFSGRIPKAVYTLSGDEKTEVLEWLTSLRFSDGFVSNIGRFVQQTDNRVFGMKSNDCQVFMQRLLPTAFKELLPVGVWGPLAELSLFFRSICSSTMDKQRIEVLERDAPLMLCQS